MKPLIASLLLFIVASTIEVNAQVDVQVQPEMQILVLMLRENISQDNGLPVVKVELGKVLLRNGGFVKEIPIRPQEMKLRDEMLKQQYRLYRGPMQFGIYKYVSVPDEKKPRKGDSFISAIPVDRDATVQAMTAQTKEQADILNLLSLTVEEAAAAVKSETKLNDSLAKAEATEIALLRTGKLDKAPLFFVPVRAQK
jgi:hypothetical protein